MKQEKRTGSDPQGSCNLNKCVCGGVSKMVRSEHTQEAWGGGAGSPGRDSSALRSGRGGYIGLGGGGRGAVTVTGEQGWVKAASFTAGALALSLREAGGGRGGPRWPLSERVTLLCIEARLQGPRRDSGGGCLQ